MRPGEVLLDLLVLAVFDDDFFQLGMLFGNFLEARGIAHQFGRRELLRHLLVARIKLVQFFSQCQYGHGKSSWKVQNRKSKLENRKWKTVRCPVSGAKGESANKTQHTSLNSRQRITLNYRTCN